MSTRVDFIESGYSPRHGLGRGHWVPDSWGVLRWEGEIEVDDVIHPPRPRRKCPTCATDIGPRAALCDSCRIKARRAGR